MSRYIVVAFIALAVGNAAFAMTPKTEAFLRSIGLDPASDAVKVADADGTIEVMFHGDPAKFSLDILADKGAQNGIRQFIVMRNFIRQLKADFGGTPFPEADYNSDYLTQDERQLVARKVRESP